MKKILLTTIYPLWFFFSKIYIGNLILIPIAISPIPILFCLIFPELMLKTGDEAQGIGMGLGLLSLICVPITGGFIMKVGDALETNYEKWNYKV